MSEILKNSSIICRCLNSSGISHFIGGTSLIGVYENDFTKYSKSPYIYVYNYNIYKIIKLFILLFFYRFFLKLKFRSGQFQFKFRKKDTLFTKSEEYYNLIFGIKKSNIYKFYTRGEYVEFHESDISGNSIINFNIKSNIIIGIPRKLNSFIEKYKINLQLDQYKKYPIYLDKSIEIFLTSFISKP